MARRVREEDRLLAVLQEGLVSLRSLLPNLGPRAAKKAAETLSHLGLAIEEARAGLDPIKHPGRAFDPADPETAGRLVSIALMAQERVPLGALAKSYGSGVYAIYYTGNHPAYLKVTRTETPVYVGKADPKRSDAKTAQEQGPQLFNRLADHRRMIKTVGAYAVQKALSDALRIEDFECRRLVCATNAQLVAERHLIGVFHPIWNSETGICWGISKHGDLADNRADSRTPWDVLHPGRQWALDPILQNSLTEQQILDKLRDHFGLHPPFRDRTIVVERILTQFSQHAPLVTSEAEANADDEVAAHDPLIQAIED